MDWLLTGKGAVANQDRQIPGSPAGDRSLCQAAWDGGG